MPAANFTAVLHRLAPDDTPDGELLARYVQTKDETAFATLVARHGRMVRAVCKRVLRHDADADDAAQATFLILARKAATLRDRHGLANWLFGVAHNVATRARQARTRRAANEAKMRPREPKEVASDFAELLHAELAKLPAANRAAVVLCDLEGQTLATAAKHLGVPVGTVASRLARGRTQLANRLTKLGLSVSVGLLSTLLGDSARGAGVSFTPTAAVSETVHTLAEETMRAIMTTPKVVNLLALAVAVIALGSGLAVLAGDPPKAKLPEEPKAKPAEKRVTEIPLDDKLTRATISRDGKVLATVTQKDHDNANPAVVTFWDTATGKQIGTLGDLKNYNAVNIALSPDGSAFAWIQRDTVQDNDIAIQVFDTKKGELRCVAGSVSVLDTGYPDLTFSPDGKRLATSRCGIGAAGPRRTFLGGADVLDAEKGGRVFGNIFHIDSRSACPVFADGGKSLLTVGVSDGKVILWDRETSQQERSFDLADTEKVKTNAITPDGKKLVTFHENGENVVWDIESGKRDVALADQEGNVLHTGAVAVSADGKRVAAVVNPPNGKLKLKVWDVKSGKLLLTKEKVGPQTVCFDDAGRVAVCDNSLKKIVFHTVPE